MSDSALYKRNLLCPNIRNLKESVFSFYLSSLSLAGQRRIDGSLFLVFLYFSLVLQSLPVCDCKGRWIPWNTQVHRNLFFKRLQILCSYLIYILRVRVCDMGMWYCEKEEWEGKRKTAVKMIPRTSWTSWTFWTSWTPCFKQDKNQDKPLDEDGGRCPAAQSSALVL